MKICIISRGDIFPPNHGAAVKLYYTMLALASLGNDVFFVTEDSEKYYRVRGGEFMEIRYPLFFEKIFDRMDWYRKVVLWLGIPEKDWILFHPIVNLNMWLRTLYVTLKEEVNVLQAEFPAFGFPALFSKLLTGTKVSLVEHNVEYFRIQRSAKNLKERGRKTIKFVEKFVGKLADFVVTVSEEDRQRLKEMDVETSKVIPHGVDIERFEGGEGKKVKEELKIGRDEKVLIFHGVLNYPPNKGAVDAILDEILPKLREMESKFKVLIVGGYPPSINEEEVVTTGFVDRLEDYIKAADVAIVPLKAGGGTRLKILEYFASEVPTVSTRKGAEGLNVKGGKHLIFSPLQKFPEQINKILENEDLRDKLTKNAFDFIQNYSWGKIGEMYENLYGK